MTIRYLVFLCLVLAGMAGNAQQQQPAEESPQSADERLAVEVAQLEEQIATHRREIAMLERRVALETGVRQDVFSKRLDEAELELLDTTLRLARGVSAARERGVDVTAYATDVTMILDSLPGTAIEAANKVRERMVLLTGAEPPAEVMMADQTLAAAIDDIDTIFATILAYLDVAPEFGIDTDSERAALVELLQASAANRSVFLELALTEARKLRNAVATLPNDENLTARLAVIEERIDVGSQALQAAVEQMNQLELDTGHYRQQLLTATGEITTDVLDIGLMAGLAAEWTAVATEIVANEGPRLVFSVLLALVLLLLFLQIGKVAQKLVASGLRSERINLSNLLQKMILSTVRNVILVVGVLIALSQLGISLGPLLAGLGIAGFVVGFALQDSLSNFASGMMILFYRPFDVGDFVEVAGVKGKVDSMSLVNTTFLTIDNQKLVVPNNMIWQSVIANYTDQSTRRVDLVFGISYDDDIDKAEEVIRGVLDGNDRILEEPEPVVKVGELGDSSVNLIVRPWVRTEDYWDTYWDLTKQVKQAFDREGITIPFPQRDVHVIRPQPTSAD